MGTGSAVSRQCLDASVKIYGNNIQNIQNYILNQIPVCIGEAVLEVQPKALKPSTTQVT